MDWPQRGLYFFCEMGESRIDHRGPSFRLIVGSALAQRHGYDFPSWDAATPRAARSVNPTSPLKRM
jgi:hypothetical protein